MEAITDAVEEKKKRSSRSKSSKSSSKKSEISEGISGTIVEEAKKT